MTKYLYETYSKITKNRGDNYNKLSPLFFKLRSLSNLIKTDYLIHLRNNQGKY